MELERVFLSSPQCWKSLDAALDAHVIVSLFARFAGMGVGFRYLHRKTKETEGRMKELDSLRD